MYEDENLKHFKGRDLLLYVENCSKNKKLAEAAELIEYAVMDTNKACELLEYIIRENKRLVAIYPMLGEKPTKDMVYIGTIIEGELYML